MDTQMSSGSLLQGLNEDTEAVQVGGRGGVWQGRGTGCWDEVSALVLYPEPFQVHEAYTLNPVDAGGLYPEPC